MIRAVIIDDENHCIEDLSELLNEFSDKIMLVGTASTVAEAVKLVEKERPSLVFLDVILGKQIGFDFLKCFDTLTFEVIFTTAYQKYAIEAFKFSAFDYLLKPIDNKIFKETILRLNNTLNNTLQLQKMEVLFNFLKQETLPEKLILPTLNGFELVKISDILFCRGDINYSHIYLVNKTKLVVAKTLKYIEELLNQYNFYRIHKTYLVNLDHIKKYNKGKGGYVVLADGSKLDVSHRRKDGFLEVLTKKSRAI